MIAVVVAFSYPLQSHPSRSCILSIVRSIRAIARGGSGQPDAQPDGPPDAHGLALPPLDRTYYVVTTLFILSTLAIALAVDDITVVLSVVGATGSTIVTYLLPGFCFFRLCRDTRQPMARLALLQCGMGLVLMPLCLTLIFVK